ncbi:MAG: anhydro-N-acetylmuramic acid kinase [Gemmatimonadaceae bacterium]|nr:anhydro-N-acetylmuramic acid kinase [Gemmatimonadaceae bacterium]
MALIWPGTARPDSDVLVGLMSGTSLDGVSAAVVRFREDATGRIAPDLLAFTEIAYDGAMRGRLAAALNGAKPAEYARLDFDLGGWLARAAIEAIAEAGVARSDIAAIASHGHTVWHDPPHATWQFGQAAVIAERLGLPVVSDFRVRDVAAGGQGAPLVPIADALLFAAPGHWRALQNLGGIGNVTIVPPADAARSLAGVRAFDTGPGVCVIDGVTQLVRPGLAYDHGGALARSGSAIEAVVDALLAEPFFAAEPPRSTGRELFTERYIEDFFARCRSARHGCSDADVVATAVRFTARSIALAFERFIPEPVAELVLSGGGARNPALFDAIEAALDPVPTHAAFSRRAVRRFDDAWFDGSAKEAVAFAFLGWLHLKGRPGNVRAATGARGPRVLGTYTPA